MGRGQHILVKDRPVSAANPLAISLPTNGPNFDGFNNLRVSSPKTLLDLKQNVDNLPLFYDDAEASGSGTGSAYQTNKAATRLSVSATTAGQRVRQSKVWGNYQPGKCQKVLVTFANIESVSGITKQAGYYWDNWGIYTKHKDGTAYVGIRTYNTGSPVDSDVAQSSWNLDTMDGTGSSGVTLDFTKVQILIIDFEWLGVGRVRIGWVIDGIIIYCHEFLHTNINTEVYMSNPNAPIRYEIENDGTGAADTFDTICASIQSEGGQEATNITTYQSRNGTPITLANQDLFTPIISFRLKSSRLCTRITPKEVSIIVTSSSINYEWALFLNPTIAGTDAVSWSDITNSGLSYDVTRDNTNTLSGGYIIAGGYGATSGSTKIPVNATAESFLSIGSNIDGTLDELVLGVKNIDGNGGTTYGGVTLSEYC